MQKKTKKVLVTVLAVLFALSAGYFALVAPTTAWYYQEENDSYSFKFGDFDVEQENRQEITTAIPLRAATRFADEGEILFDEVVHVVKVDAENSGGMTAQVKVKVTESENNPEGLKWFIYDTALENEIPEVTGGPIAEKGGYKTAVENMLRTYNVTPVNYTNLTSADVEAEYEAYNSSAVTALDSHNSNKIVFDSGEQRVIYVVFWAEYGEVKETLDVDSTVTIGNYDVDIKFEAGPYMPEYQEITIFNESASAANIRLYLNGSTTPYSGAYYYVTGENEQQMNAANGLIGVSNDEKEYKIRLEVGTPFKLLIANSGASIKFEAEENKGTVSGVSDMVVTGTVTNFGNYVKVVNA